MFQQNENNTDRLVRVVIGVIGLVVGFMTSGVVQIAAFIVAFFGLFTAITGFCLLYKLLGISTKK